MQFNFTIILLFIYSASLFAIPPADKPPLEIAEMQDVAEKILKDLKAAKGILSTEPPSIEVKTFGGGTKIAQMVFDQKRIELDIKTFNICVEVTAGRDNALAFIIGHELGHYLNAHKQVNHHTTRPSVNQGFAVLSPNANPVLRASFSNAINTYRSTFEEAEADLEGAFLGYMAGYDTGPAGQELLRKVYADPQMGLTNTTTGYPTLDERINIVRETSEQLALLTPLFETAKYLTAIGQYADAIPYLEKVASKFESREIYNNIGVLLILEFLEQIRNPQRTISEYEFPISFDSDFRAPHHQFVRDILSAGQDLDNFGVFQFVEPCRLSFLQVQLLKAKEFFNKAIYLDQDYATAYLNLSIVQAINAQFFGTSECVVVKKVELDRALANAHFAAEQAEKELQGHFIEYFDFFPSGNKEAISYPVDLRFNNESADNYPYFKEVFDQSDIFHGAEVEKKDALFTRWGPDEPDVPAARRLLSNAYVQIDLVHILNGKRTANKRLRGIAKNGVEHEYIPFTRAVEIDGNNKLASKNLFIAKNAAGIPTAMTGPVLFFSQLTGQIITVGDQNVREIQKGISNSDWIDEVLLDTSRLTSFFEQLEVIDNNIDLAQHEKVVVQYTFKRANTASFQIYHSESLPFGQDNRIESCTFLIPKSFNSFALVNDVSIANGMNLSDLSVNIGTANRSMNINSGNLLTYQSSLNRNNYQTPLNDGTDATGERIVVPFRGTIIKIDPNHIPNQDTRIDASELMEHGIIVDVDNFNKVKGWVLYHRRIKTGFIDTPND